MLSHKCIRISITMKRHYDHSNPYEEKKFNWSGLLTAQSSVHFHHGGKCDMQAHMVLRFLHLAGNRNDSVSLGGAWIYLDLKAPTVAHFCKQDHTYSYKTTRPLTPFPLGPIPFKSTTSKIIIKKKSLFWWIRFFFLKVQHIYTSSKFLSMLILIL